MKRLVPILAVFLVAGCSTYQRLQSGDTLRVAALKAIGAEQVAWLTHDSAAIPRGMDSLVELKNMRAFIDDIRVTGGDGTVTATYWYSGTFSTEKGKGDGTLRVQRRLRFKKGDSGNWTQSAPAEEIARNYKVLSAAS